MNETRQLTRFVAETQYDDLPHDVVDKIKIYVLDNLASGFVGAVQPWSRMIASLVQETGGKREVSVFNQARKADVSRGALINGAMIGAFEMEHVGFSAHPGGTVFPAALSIAERERLDGKSFIIALALGYEVNCRIGEAQTNAVETERGFHNPSVNGVFGAAVAAGKMLRLDEPILSSAMGIAGSHACGLVEFAWEGAMTKRMHLGRASQLGLESALLARVGFTGPTTVLEGRYGYFHAYSPKPEIEKLLAGLGHRWLLRELIIKPYGCHLGSQAIVQHIQEFRKTHTIDPQAVKRIVVTGNPRFMAGRFSDQEPNSILGGQYSIPFTVAVAILKDMSDPLVFSDETLWDSSVRGLSKKVETLADKKFGRFRYDSSAAVIIELEEGRHLIEVDDFKGSASRPMTCDEATEKFLRVTRTLVDGRKARRIIGLARDLEELPDIRLLARLIRGRDRNL